MEKELTNTRLLEELISIIELSKQDAAIHVNRSMTMSFWQIGKRIKTHILKSKRAAYGEQVIALLSKDLSHRYGRSFKARNLRRMVQFSEVFSDPKIVTTLSSQLSWSHFILLFPIKEKEKRSFYAERIASERMNLRNLTKS